ncbi:hypothetical protein, partial [Aeromonas rivipollensis]
MKWIFALLFLFSVNSFAVQTLPAKENTGENIGTCKAGRSGLGNFATLSSASQSSCLDFVMSKPSTQDYPPIVPSGSWYDVGSGCLAHRFNWAPPNSGLSSYTASFCNYVPQTTYTCPPDGNPTFTSGPIDLNGSKVCQTLPKICMMGAVIQLQGNGAETCVSNCSSAAGLIRTSEFYYQAGPDVGSTAGQVQCYGQCAVQTSGGYTQLSSGAYTGTFAFTGANCPVIRPEPTVDSESNTGGNGDAPSVDESTTSEGTDNALG